MDSKQDMLKGQASLDERYHDRKRELFCRLEALKDSRSISGPDLQELIDNIHKLAGTAGFFGEDALG